MNVYCVMHHLKEPAFDDIHVWKQVLRVCYRFTRQQRI